MQDYGYLFGFILLRKDLHHDEVYVSLTKEVVMRNSIWLLSRSELYDLAKELGFGKVTIIDWSDF